MLGLHWDFEYSRSSSVAPDLTPGELWIMLLQRSSLNPPALRWGGDGHSACSALAFPSRATGPCGGNLIPFTFPTSSFLRSSMVLYYFPTDQLVDVFPRQMCFHFPDGDIDVLVLFVCLLWYFTPPPEFSASY